MIKYLQQFTFYFLNSCLKLEDNLWFSDDIGDYPDREHDVASWGLSRLSFYEPFENPMEDALLQKCMTPGETRVS